MLLQLASEHQFRARVTVDQGFDNQQNANTLPIPVLIMIARAHRFRDLEPLVPNIVSILNSDPGIGFFFVLA